MFDNDQGDISVNMMTIEYRRNACAFKPAVYRKYRLVKAPSVDI